MAFNRSPEKTHEIMAEGLEGAFSPEEAVAALPSPRIVWLMVPAGDATESTHGGVRGAAVARATPSSTAATATSRTPSDATRCSRRAASSSWTPASRAASGASRTATARWSAATVEAVAPLEPIFRSLAPEGGYIHCGPAGAGHFTKMVHNGIEYGLMQAYAEGFEILHASEYRLDLAAVAKAWQYGTVIRSWLLELAGLAFEQHGNELPDIRGWVADSGEGRWTVQEAMDLDVPAPVITLSLLARFRSRQSESYSAKVTAALRQQFGGHAVKSRVVTVDRAPAGHRATPA